ncbi:hypothetical protein AAA799D07_00489 [Marine Group I thaumarchaeote SCGC AAA799-D07]|nr:hypothetical protein AAA799D07_00489 [Marine Group I thaumarchaeote SCGC AAA799-D07]
MCQRIILLKLSVFDKIIETNNLDAKQVLEIAKSTVREFF